MAEAGPGGVGEVVGLSLNLARAALSIGRRLTVDVAQTTVETGKEVIEGARAGKPSSELAATLVNGWVEGARRVLGVDQDLQRMSDEVTRVAGPVAGRVADHVPEQVRDAVHHVGALAPVRAVTSLTGMAGATVTDVRRTLRQQGMELLKRSTKLDDPDEHPAMAHILAGLSPDEARIVRFLGERGPQAVVDVVAHNPMTRKFREMVHNYSIVGREAGCIRPERSSLYLDNLHRLGLAVVRDYRLRSQPNYDLLYCQPEVQNVRKPQGRLVRLKIVHKGVELSEFGKEMFRQCLETETSRLCAVPDKL